MSDESSGVQADVRSAHFATTQWSIVAAAGNLSGEDAQQALAHLCETYWYPLYAYVRRRVADVHQAQDLTQAFFVHLLEKEAIGKADRDRGRFRTFLLAALQNFLVNQWNKDQAAKRGGGRAKLSLDFESGESRFRIEPVDELTPELSYERRWIMTLLDHVLGRLRSELVAAGKGDHFEHLKESIAGETTADQYQNAAKALGISAAAAKQAAYRMRRRYRQLFRDEVARTVAEDSDVDDEISRLLATLGAPQ